jgi:hypothetical protein
MILGESGKLRFNDGSRGANDMVGLLSTVEVSVGAALIAGLLLGGLFLVIGSVALIGARVVAESRRPAVERLRRWREQHPWILSAIVAW